MSAVQAIKVARAAGIELAVDGNKLLIDAASEPPASVIEELRQHKVDIVKLLRSEERLPEIPGSPERDDCREGGVCDLQQQTTGDHGADSFASALATLRRYRPAYVVEADWQQMVADAEVFVAAWGRTAETLGWSVDDLFGLHEPPARPHPSYRRLSRYDCTGVIWLLHGRPVIALTETEATILAPSGAKLKYCKHNKPALGPLSDSLDDSEARPPELTP
jgi:hypothetical protein